MHSVLLTGRAPPRPLSQVRCVCLDGGVRRRWQRSALYDPYGGFPIWCRFYGDVSQHFEPLVAREGDSGEILSGAPNIGGRCATPWAMDLSKRPQWDIAYRVLLLRKIPDKNRMDVAQCFGQGSAQNDPGWDFPYGATFYVGFPGRSFALLHRKGIFRGAPPGIVNFAIPGQIPQVSSFYV